MKLQTLTAKAIKNKTVIVRVDYNVPLEHTKDRSKVADATRIELSIPTITFLREHGAKIILISHLGRPKAGANCSIYLETPPLPHNICS